MSHKPKLAKICVSLSIKDWSCFMALQPICRLCIPTGCQYQTAKGFSGLPSPDLWSKQAIDPYHRRFDAYPRLKLAIRHSFKQDRQPLSACLKLAMIWVNLCFGRIYVTEKS